MHKDSEYPLGYYKDDPLPDHTIYLTFDDGPADWTEEILNTLQEYNIKATFFICANWGPGSLRKQNSFKKYRNVLERMINEGHVLGNHTAGHLNLAALNDKKINMQFDLNQELLNQELGDIAPQMTLIRPPFGHPWNTDVKPEERKRIADVIKTKGLVMMWSKKFNSKDSKDWVKGEWFEKGEKIDVDNKEFKDKMQNIYNRLVNGSKGKGMVILFHDTHLTSVKILPELIKQFISMGYHFATMEDYVRWKWTSSSKELLLKNKSNPQGQVNEK